LLPVDIRSFADPRSSSHRSHSPLNIRSTHPFGFFATHTVKNAAHAAFLTISRLVAVFSCPPRNHVGDIAACDFFVVPTATFRVLYVFFVLAHDRRRVLHFNVTTNPYEAWAAQQIVGTFPNELTKKYLIRDNDSTYGAAFRARLKAIGIEDTPTAPRSPWQNPYAERMVGTFRRDCLDHLIILNEAHLTRLLTEFLEYYHTARCHKSLDCNSPDPREVEPPERGEVISVSVLGGLHHRYMRRAA
jgi:putative transposase